MIVGRGLQDGVSSLPHVGRGLQDALFTFGTVGYPSNSQLAETSRICKFLIAAKDLEQCDLGTKFIASRTGWGDKEYPKLADVWESLPPNLLIN
ncbi:hypothetical protein AAES_131074 [Amazona aestiva]|uniref:Uncharacterized protein n=1 Tax=Amazona aestiva TaxID=12930 RepID=A0A0Q3UR10_AMAAE|nr:hypothetical protein AAES_131074 [Amazona aestiva]